MIKQEISEIKKLFNPKKCSIDRICGCYVDGEKNKKTQFSQAFLALPEEEMFKYFEILKKALSGSLGKNLINLEFPLSSEEAGGTQEFLYRLKQSGLRDDALLEQFYDQIISSYEYVGNYLILIIHDSYDVPKHTSDGIENEDASDEVYEYVLACVCPVELSKPGLSYNPEENAFQNRIRDWVVSMPQMGFLFPAFNDRSTDLHGVLYYTKDGEDLKDGLVDAILGCPLPLSAGSQKETFHAIIEETLEDACDLEIVKNIHEKLTEMVEEHKLKEDPEPLILDKNEVKTILADSGVSNEKLAHFEEHYEETAGEDAELFVSNVMNAKSFEVKTPDVVVKVKPERTDLIETRVIDGRQCLVIALDGTVEVNGITVRKSLADFSDTEE
ncbi:MAG: DUF4317 domain-containing protein [Lachnospiraceae bacterium]|nr:DUF4317 domain-containing protein [Lachnospiraceae bacterium]